MNVSCCSMMSLYASICRFSFSFSSRSNFRLRSASGADVTAGANRSGDVTTGAAGATRMGEV